MRSDCGNSPGVLSLRPALLVLAAFLVVPLLVAGAVAPSLRVLALIQQDAWANPPSEAIGDASRREERVGDTFAFHLAALSLIREILPDLTSVGYLTTAGHDKSEVTEAAAQIGLTILVDELEAISAGDVLASYRHFVREGVEAIVLDDGVLWPMDLMARMASASQVPIVHRQIISVGPSLCMQVPFR